VPLFGGKIEEIVAEQVRRLLEAETEFTVRWLGSHYWRVRGGWWAWTGH
jgi:Protein of unknown function (DUF2505)